MARLFVDNAASPQGALSTKAPLEQKQFIEDMIKKLMHEERQKKLRDAIKRKGIKGAPLSVRNNRSHLLYALEQDHRSWRSVPGEIQKDPKFALQAVNANWRVYQFFPQELKAIKKIALAAVTKFPLCVDWVPVSLLQDTPEITLRAVSANPTALEGVLKIKDLVLSEERKIALFKAATKTLYLLKFCLENPNPQKYPLMKEAYNALRKFL